MIAAGRAGPHGCTRAVGRPAAGPAHMRVAPPDESGGARIDDRHGRPGQGHDRSGAGSHEKRNREGHTAVAHPLAPPRRHGGALRRRGRGLGVRRGHRRVPARPGGSVGVRARARARDPGRRLPQVGRRGCMAAPGAPRGPPVRARHRPVRPPGRRRPQRGRRLRARRNVAHQRRRGPAPEAVGLRREVAGRAPGRGRGPRRARPLLRAGRAHARLDAVPRDLGGADQAVRPAAGRRGDRRHGDPAPDQRHVQRRPQRRRHRATGVQPLRRLRQRVQPPGQEHGDRELPARRGGARRPHLLRGLGAHGRAVPRRLRRAVDRRLRAHRRRSRPVRGPGLVRVRRRRRPRGRHPRIDRDPAPLARARPGRLPPAGPALHRQRRRARLRLRRAGQPHAGHRCRPPGGHGGHDRRPLHHGGRRPHGRAHPWQGSADRGGRHPGRAAGADARGVRGGGRHRRRREPAGVRAARRPPGHLDGRRHPRRHRWSRRPHADVPRDERRRGRRDPAVRRRHGAGRLAGRR